MIQLPELIRRLRKNTIFPVSFNIAGTAAATTTNYPENLSILPSGVVVPAVKVVAVVASWAVASTSGTLMVKKIPTATALASGTDILTAAIAMSGTANTPTAGTLVTTEATLILGPTDRLGVVAAGTLTNQSGVGCTIWLQPLDFNRIDPNY